MDKTLAQIHHFLVAAKIAWPAARFPIAVLTALIALSSGRCAMAAACIPSGDESAINAALSGPNARAVLCAGAVFKISQPIGLTADGQTLYTEGSPSGRGRALIRVSGATQTNAIYSRASGISVHHIIVDGSRSTLGRTAKTDALIDLGGDVSDISVDHVRAYDPRGWSVLRVFEGNRTCTGAHIADNELGPSGHPDAWADGLSFACRNSRIEHNRIIDASDGGIVIFGAPGTVVTENIIATENNTLLGGINLVDFGPFHGDYTGVVVSRNRIEANGGYIKVAIAAGPAVWGDSKGLINRGATISDNVLSGANFGFGIAVDGVSDFIISGNRAPGHFSGTKGPGCWPQSAAPGHAFIRNPKTSAGKFQPNFEDGTLGYLICAVKDQQR